MDTPLNVECTLPARSDLTLQLTLVEFGGYKWDGGDCFPAINAARLDQFEWKEAER